MQVHHLEHKHGGRIVKVDAVEHATDRGVAYWFYRGDVEWRDGGKSVGTEIPPWAICYDHSIPEAHAEYDTCSAALNGHLLEHGEWLERTKFTRDGRAVAWVAKSKAARTAV